MILVPSAELYCLGVAKQRRPSKSCSAPRLGISRELRYWDAPALLGGQARCAACSVSVIADNATLAKLIHGDSIVRRRTSCTL